VEHGEVGTRPLAIELEPSVDDRFARQVLSGGWVYQGWGTSLPKPASGRRRSKVKPGSRMSAILRNRWRTAGARCGKDFRYTLNG